MNKAFIEKIVADDIRDGIILGEAILAGSPEGELFSYCAGHATLAKDTPMTLDTVIDGASTTKVVAVVTALLILHKRGLIDFDAPFTNYLPQYEAKLDHVVTIRQMANHVSGFNDFVRREDGQRLYYAEDGATMMNNLMRLPPPKPPSAHAEYACWNYILLAQIIEAITSERLDDFCMREIFQPLGMDSTSLGKPLANTPPERLAQTFGTKQPGEISDYIAYRLFRDGFRTGNAGLFCTAHDYAKLLSCVINHGRYGGGQLFDEREFSEISPDKQDKTDGYRRFGWVVRDKHSCDECFGTSLLHSGWSGQTIFLDMEKRLYIIVLTPRIGDYERAKQHRFDVINHLYKNI